MKTLFAMVVIGFLQSFLLSCLGLLKYLIPERHRDEFHDLLLPPIPPPNEEKPK
jgi:hypothetical protein